MIAQFNERVTNHVIRLWAGRVPHMAERRASHHVRWHSGTYWWPVMFD